VPTIQCEIVMVGTAQSAFAHPTQLRSRPA